MSVEKLICFDPWEVYDGFFEGSGRSEKIWLKSNVDDRIGLLKFNKTEKTTEHISEKLASELGAAVGIPCAEIQLGQYQGRIGSMSYLIPTAGEILIEGVNLISKINPDFDPDRLYDPVKNEWYSIEMSIKALSEYHLEKDFYRMLVFDFLIGNSDRHQSNWSIIRAGDHFYFGPLYDNGSSLCCYVNHEKISSYLGNDLQLFQSLVNTKSRARVRLTSNAQRPPRHTDVLRVIFNESGVQDLMALMIKTITPSFLENLFLKYPDTLLEKKRKTLIRKYLLAKIELIKEMMEKEDNE